MNLTLIKELTSQKGAKTSPSDVVETVMNLAVKIATQEMTYRKVDYEKKMDELDDPFDTSQDHLADITEEIVNSIVEQLNEKTVKDYIAAIKKLQ